MTAAFLSHIDSELEGLKSAGLYKSERVITSTQSAEIEVGGEKVLNFCANNYLGLADNADLRRGRQAGARSLWLRHGVGALHLRHAGGAQAARGHAFRPSSAWRTRSSIGSCFDANGGLFETLLGEEDAIISDALNHASIIDGVRLSKAKRFRYANNDMADLEARAEGGRRLPLPADRHRRRVLHGRHHRQSGGRLRSRREIRRHGDGRRQPCRRLRRQTRARLARALRRRGPDRHHHRHARQGAGRRLGRLYLGQKPKSSTGCVSARGPISSPTR